MNKEIIKSKMVKTGVFTATILTAMVAVPYVMDAHNVAHAETENGFAGGAGTVANPYQVATYEQLQLVAQNYTSHFILVDDIDMNYNAWNPIGNKTLAFQGTFDGNGHTISNLSVTSTTGYAGLFGNVSGVAIHDLKLNNVQIQTTDRYAGGLVGYAKDSNIYNVDITNATIVGTNNSADYLGGVVGYISGKPNTSFNQYNLNRIYAHANIESNSGDYVGGIAGYMSSGATASELVSEGSATSNGSYVGGIVGSISSGTLLNAISYSDTAGSNAVGGIAGTSSGTKIQYAFAYGMVNGDASVKTSNVGGLVGSMDGKEIYTSFAFNPLITGPKAATTGKAFGTVGSTVSKTYIVVYDQIAGESHSTGVTTTMTRDDFTSMTKYKRYGLSFNKSVWYMIDGETQPFLMFHPVSSTYDTTTGKWYHTPISKNEIIGADAEEAVALAEQMKLISYVNPAQGLVDQLDEGDYRDGLQKRLDAVMKYINAENAVSTAEYYKTIEKVNEAQPIVDLVENSVDRQAFQDRLDAIKTEIQAQASLYAEALAAVEKAEGTFATGDMEQTQIDKDAAQVLVNKLTDAGKKAELQARLDALQKSIDEDNAKKEAEQAINKARQAVEKAEQSKVQTDVDIARPLVNALPDGVEKTDLKNRLDAVQTYIDALAKATKAVENAEAKKTQDSVDVAQGLIDVLVQDEKRQALQDRLDAIQTEIDKAKADKEKEENLYLELKQKILAVQAGVQDGTIDVSEYDTYRAKLEEYRIDVNTLKDATKVKELNNLIDYTISLMQEKEVEIQLTNDALAAATIAVEKAEKTIALTDINEAQSLIDVLKPSDAKTALQERLDAVKDIYNARSNAEKAVKNAEDSPSMTNINVAQVKVTALPDDTDGFEAGLQARLDAVLAGLFADAEAKVVKAENNVTQTNINTAQAAVDKLPDGDVKNGLQARIDALQVKLADDSVYDDALKAVEYAEKYPSLVNINGAQSKVNLVKDSDERKPELQKRLDAVLEGLFADAEAKVVKAEGSKAQTDIKAAYTTVNRLPDGERKDALLERLAKLEQQIKDDSLYDNALAAVVQAEKSKTLTAISFAQGKIDLMNDSDTRKAELQARLDAVLEGLFADAEAKVTNAENNVTDANIATAQTAINKLPDGERKDALQARLDGVKKHLVENNLYDAALAAVQKAEANTNATTLKTAQDKVNLMPDTDIRKAELQARIDAALKALEEKATQAVVKAEGSKEQVDVDSARTIVSNLPSGELKTELTARLDAIQKAIKEKQEMDNLYETALAAVQKAEANPTILNIKNADAAVQKVKDADERKADLVERVDALYYILQLEEATKAVQKAESYYKMNLSYVTDAENKVKALKDSSEKSALQERIDAIYKKIDDENYKTALGLVENAEKPQVRKKISTLQSAIASAQPAVDKLLDSERKTDLQTRLDALAAELDKLINKNGTYNPGDDIIEVASSVKDEAAREYFVKWATAIVFAENNYTNNASVAVVSAKNAVPASYMTNPDYATMVEEFNARTNVLLVGRTNFNFMTATLAKNSFIALLAFEADRTAANKQAALNAIDLMKLREGGSKQVTNALTERINRIEIE